MSDQPTIVTDYELLFTNGTTYYLQVVEDRDVVAEDKDYLLITLHPDEHTVDKSEILKNTLALRRTTQRTLPPEKPHGTVQ